MVTVKSTCPGMASLLVLNVRFPSPPLVRSALSPIVGIIPLFTDVNTSSNALPSRAVDFPGNPDVYRSAGLPWHQPQGCADPLGPGPLSAGWLGRTRSVRTGPD